MQSQNNKVNKVLHIIAPVKFGGGESVLLDLLRCNSPQFDLNVLLLCRSIEFEKKLLEYNLHYKVLQFQELPPNASPFIFFVLMIKLIFRRVVFSIGGSYDLLHCHGFPAVIIGFMNSFSLVKPKLVYTHHQQVFISNSFITGIFKFIYSRFNILTFVSDTILRNFTNKFKTRNTCLRIYNPVSDIFFQTKINRSSKVKIRLVYPSRFSHQKAHIELIKSFLCKKSISADYEIHFFGSGELKSRCVKLVDDNCLNHIFKFHDLVGQDVLAKELLNFDISIFPSHYEGFGVAAAECIASQIPVIYNFNNDTLHEVVSNCGWPIKLDQMVDFLDNINAEMIHSKVVNCKVHSKQFNSNEINSVYHKLYYNLLYNS